MWRTRLLAATMGPPVVLALLALAFVVIMIAAHDSLRRMWEELAAGRRRFAVRLLGAPLLFLLLALIFWLAGKPFYAGAGLFLFMAWLALAFWGEL